MTFGQPVRPCGVKTACSGPVTAETCRKNGIEPDIVAEEYTISGLVEAMGKFLEDGAV